MIRNSAREVLLAGARSLGLSTSILQAEAWGLLEGIRGAISLISTHLYIEGDILAVINAINSTWRIPGIWTILLLIQGWSCLNWLVGERLIVFARQIKLRIS